MPKFIGKAEVDPQIALETLRKLARYGFGDAEFELVHHWHARGKLNRFKGHCERLISRRGQFRFGDNNHLLHLRLLCVLKTCDELPPGRKDFISLADEALNLYPPIEKDARSSLHS